MILPEAKFGAYFYFVPEGNLFGYIFCIVRGIKGVDSGMMVAIDIGSGDPVSLARIGEKDRPALFAWLKALKEELGVEVLASDDFNSYFVAADKLDLEHQICRFHYLRWTNRLLNRLQKELDDTWL